MKQHAFKDVLLLLLRCLIALGLLVFVGIGCGGGDGSPVGVTPWTGDPTIRTLYGVVKGFQNTGPGNQADTWVWKAIPYAKPPIGPLRWKAPQDPDPWNVPREETKFSSVCPQYSVIGDLIVGNEDCLYLNVWRPRSMEKNLPVYFWIHGGGNSIGTASLIDYSGANLAQKSNVVVVTVNYRLGPLGWFTYPALRSGRPGDEANDSGNYGTLDLLQALTWVKDNIVAFGGNPDSVMITGESAGAFNVFSLLISPRATNLFHKAVAESGMARTNSVEEGEASARTVIVTLLVSDGTAADQAEAETYLDSMSNTEVEAYLRSKTAKQILACYEPSFGGMIMFPNIFKDGAVIAEAGFDTLGTGTYPNKVPIVIGTNKEEIKLFTFMDPYFQGKDELYKIVATYGSDMWKAIGVDGVARALRTNADQPNVYAYQFLWGSWKEPGTSVIPEPWGFKLGSCHSLEIPFFFGNDTWNVVMQTLVFTRQNRPGRKALSSAMMAYLAQFARTGDPNQPGSDLPQWSPWSNDVNEPKSILFDVDDAQSIDITMSTEELTEEGVNARMASEVPEPLYSEALEYLGSFLDW